MVADVMHNEVRRVIDGVHARNPYIGGTQVEEPSAIPKSRLAIEGRSQITKTNVAEVKSAVVAKRLYR